MTCGRIEIAPIQQAFRATAGLCLGRHLEGQAEYRLKTAPICDKTKVKRMRPIQNGKVDRSYQYFRLISSILTISYRSVWPTSRSLYDWEISEK